MEQLKHKVLNQSDAANLLNITTRQVKRLWKKYKQYGEAGLISKRRGKPSNRKLSQAQRSEIVAIIRSHYADFGPTLAAEKLLSAHSIKIGVETLRQVMIAEQIWQPKQRKAVKIYQQRQRRACLGELIQIDGSPHDWFERRGLRCTLLVLIDD